MALFPQGLSQVDQRCNAGERRVLHQLKRCLEDDYLVWHDIPLGPKARQPDFVILSPCWGVLLLEVKDWRHHNLGPATRDAVELHLPRGRVTVAHPLRQARDYAMELVDLMQRDPQLVHAQGPFAGRLLFPYGWGAVLASLRRADVADSDFASVFPESRTLLRDELEEDVDPASFQQRLWGMFSVSYPHTLTLPQRDRVRWHLFPEMRVPVQGALDFADSEPAALPDLLPVMDLQQEQLARTLGEGHRVIHGAAGSGKTMILIHRAQHLAAAARADQPILVLCFNRELAGRITHLLRQRGVDERVQVRTFHAWCQDLVRSYQLSVPGAPKGDAYFTALAQTVERAVEQGRVPGGQYLALLIDEAHDFQDAWLRIAGRMVNPATHSLLVLYDDAQSIYQGQRRKFNFASVGIEARGRTSILRLNYRNTTEVLSLAMFCAQSLLQGDGKPATTVDDDEAMPLVQPASAGRHGAMPVLVEARHAAEEADLLAERVAAALAGGLSPSDVALLCRTRAMMAPLERALAARHIPLQSMNATAYRRFDWAWPSVKLLTLHSAKGLEFPLVIVAGLQSLPLGDEPLEDAVRLLYVAMTRATHELVLSAHGPSPLVQRVREALSALA
jgi:Nuclease-related domain/AAA domain/UvrD-like helicase C-terminal domain